MMPISNSSVFQSQTIDPTAPAKPLDSVTADATAVQAIADAPPPASVTVELSLNAQFINAVSLSQQRLSQLSNTDSTGQQSTLLSAVQILVDAFNSLPATDSSQTLLESPNLQSQLVQSLNSTNTNPGAPGTAEALAQIGISLQSPQFSSISSKLSLDSGVLTSVFGSNGQATVSTLQQTLDSFSQIATQFAEQLSVASSAALPALTNTPTASLTPADVLESQRLSLDQAEVSTLPPVAQPVTPQGQANTPAVLAATSAPTPQPATANSVPPAQANTLSYTQAEQAAAAQAAIQQSSAGLNTVLTAGAEAAAQATAAQNAAAAAAQVASSTNTGQNAAASLAAANAAASAALEQAQAAQRAVDILIQQHDAALAAAAQASPSQGTGSAATQQASATQTTAANLAAASAAVEAALQEARLAEDAASQAAQSQASLAATPAAPETTSSTPANPGTTPVTSTPGTQNPSSAVLQQLAEELDPLRANPALAGAIAAYNLAGGRGAATPVGPNTAPQRVSAVSSTARTGVISDQRGRTA
jgi:hypothetical protein